ncbi:PREDICTED: uncharacterized protein LOC109125204 [Camelina sativa]|uniref:Uncharacterized protein LOC109125204 n=1 Tax=Camelina sativa TaxID=90675 RepID=A0ABM1QQT4_CAMSA|nr:PREDICTED: uncharacterized protein LOC109125204 [Camelina sativa]
MGDFNETLDLSEHSHLDGQPAVTDGMRDFQSVVNYCSFADLAAHGPLFTWSNKRVNDLISKKLDRVMVNDSWLLSFPTSYSVFEAGGCSDHMRCRIELTAGAGTPCSRQKPFKFVNAITSLPEFKPFVSEAWRATEPLHMSTSTLYRFSKKLKALKLGLRQLAKNKMGDLIKKSKEAYEELCKRQEQTLLFPSPQAMNAETVAYERWERVVSLKEKYLKQRSKLHWLQVGDKTTKLFTEQCSNVRQIILFGRF